MSERDLKRIEVLCDGRTVRRTVAAAAAELAVSERQAFVYWPGTRPTARRWADPQGTGQDVEPEPQGGHPEVCD